MSRIRCLILSGGLSAILVAGQSCPDWSASFNRITDQDTLRALRANQQAGWKRQIDASGGAQAALDSGRSILAQLNAKLVNDQTIIQQISSGASGPPGSGDCSGQSALSAARCDYYQTQQAILAMQGTLEIAQCYAAQGTASPYGRTTPGLQGTSPSSPAATGIGAAVSALGTILESRAKANGANDPKIQKSQSDLENFENTKAQSSVIGDNSNQVDADATNNALNLIARDKNRDPLDDAITNALETSKDADSDGAKGPGQGIDGVPPPRSTISEADIAADDGPWADPLSTDAATNDSQPKPANNMSAVDAGGLSATSGSKLTAAQDDHDATTATTAQDVNILRDAAKDVMKQGISESGEVGETAVTLVDNLDNWGKFYSADTGDQLSGAVGIAKSVNSEFNTNPISKVVSGQALGVVGSVAQQENKILGDMDLAMGGDGAALAKLNADTDALPAEFGKSLIPGYQKVENLQLELQNATQNVQSRVKSGIQSINMFLYGTKGCVPFAADPGCP